MKKVELAEISFFDTDNRLQRLNTLGDPLVKINELVDWEIFRAPIVEALARKDNGKGGRPAYDEILLFKIAVLQGLYNIADDVTEFLINDRMTFQRFLGLTIADKVPDAKTIWNFKNILAQKDLMPKLFGQFMKQLKALRIYN